MNQNFYPFCKSPIWDLQRRYFINKGINAWSSGEVPHYVTSNPKMAQAYAAIIFAMLKDMAVLGKSKDKLFVLELGSGCGRFAYHLLKQLEQKINTHQGWLPDYCVLMSDISTANLNFWKQHPRLQAFFDQGKLDLVLFDACNDTELNMQLSNKKIQGNDLHFPLVVIANYLFDSLPQDLFYCDEGELFPVQLAIDPENSTLSTDSKIPKLVPEFALEHALNLNALKPGYKKRILSLYAERLHDSYVLFPDSGLRCIDELKKLSKNGLLLLSADKGKHRLEELQGNVLPRIVQHGSISVNTNFHAIKMHCEAAKGTSIFPLHQHGHLLIGSLLYSELPDQFPNTLSASREQIQQFSPDDFFVLKRFAEQRIEEMSFTEILSFIRLSEYDARLFLQFAPRIHELIDNLSSGQANSLVQVMVKIWDGFYPIGETQDLALEIGSILFYLKHYTDALRFLNLSEITHGLQALNLYYKALCLDQLEDRVKLSAIHQQLVQHFPNDQFTGQVESLLAAKNSY